MKQQILPRVRSIQAHMTAIWRIVANRQPNIFTAEGRLQPEPATLLALVCFAACLLLLIGGHHAR